MKYVPFNLNEHVKVKLTDYGRKVHMEDHYNFWLDRNLPVQKYIPPREDKDGWSSWQMWSLMESFGKYVGLGTKNVFDLGILVEVRDEN